MSYHGFEGELVGRIRTPWKILEMISLLPAVIYRVLLPLLLGFVVVCDRYVLDTLVTLSYFVKEPRLVSSTYAKLLVKLIPKNSLLIYFDADTDTILRRKKDEPLTEQLIEYYKKAYSDILRRLGLAAMTIDTSMTTIEDVEKTILRLVRPRLQCG
jgi:thymidylate kinase